MNILALDSCGPLVAVALSYNDCIYDISINLGFHHAENIMVACNLVIQQSGIKKSDIDLICCPKGPGSFTGLRIGLASAKGISIALSKPLVSIDTLEAYAQSTTYMPTLVVLDARKNRFYGAFFNKGARHSSNFDLSSEQISQYYFPHSLPMLVTGPGAGLFIKEQPDKKWLLDPQFMASKAPFFLSLAEDHFERYGADADSEGADYLRLSDAQELLLNQKH